MPKLTGIIKLEGTIGGMTFYKSKDGYCIREKGGVSAERIKKDPKYARTRENNQEFAYAMQSAKLIRNSIQQLIVGTADGNSATRLNQIMLKIGKSDTTSIRGQRNPQTGLVNASSKTMLKLFDFNSKAELGNVLLKQWTITATTGVIGISNLIPLNDLICPNDATHFSISGAVGVYNFTTGTYDIKFTNVVNAAIGNSVVPITLTPSALPSGTGIKFYFLKIDCFQLVNGLQYALQNSAGNSLSIIEVV